MTTAGTVATAGAVAVVLFGVVLYNRLVRARVRVDEAWAQVATDLQRRHDLVPSLVAVVRGYATHEREVFDEVTRARTAALGSHPPDERREAEDALGQALARLLLLAEDHPQLRADAGFAQLQTELTDTEDRLAFARDFAAHRVARYHELLDSFPSVVVARLVGFERRPTFVADEHARAVPQDQLLQPGADHMKTSSRLVVTGVIAAVTVGLVVSAASAPRFGEFEPATDDAFVIDQFRQEVEVGSDGRLEVVESIDVTFSESRRGIFRDLDTVGMTEPVPYDVLGVDQGSADQPWEWALEDQGSTLRVRVGDADVFLDPGPQHYRFTYVMDQLLFRPEARPDMVQLRLDVPGAD